MGVAGRTALGSVASRRTLPNRAENGRGVPGTPAPPAEPLPRAVLADSGPATQQPPGDDGQEYYYTHALGIEVTAGQRVSRGQKVAAVGAYDGRNAHLHLAVKRGSACDVLKNCAPQDARSCG
jgi:hypothetical protein